MTVVDQQTEKAGTNGYEEFLRGHRACIRQISCPSKYARSTWAEIFQALLRDHHAIALGLFRYPSDGNHLPYVVTNPPDSAVVNTLDHIFVIEDPGYPVDAMCEQPGPRQDVHLVTPSSTGLTRDRARERGLMADATEWMQVTSARQTNFDVIAAQAKHQTNAPRAEPATGGLSIIERLRRANEKLYGSSAPKSVGEEPALQKQCTQLLDAIFGENKGAKRGCGLAEMLDEIEAQLA